MESPAHTLAAIRTEFDNTFGHFDENAPFHEDTEYGDLHRQITLDREHRKPFVSGWEADHNPDETISRVHAAARMPGFSYFRVPSDESTPRAAPSRVRALEVILETMQAVHLPAHLGGERSYGLLYGSHMRYRAGGTFGKWLKGLAMEYRERVWDALNKSAQETGETGESDEEGDELVASVLLIAQERAAHYSEKNSKVYDGHEHLFAAPIVWLVIGLCVARLQYGLFGAVDPTDRDAASNVSVQADPEVVTECVKALRKLSSTHKSYTRKTTAGVVYHRLRPRSFDESDTASDSHTARVVFMYAREMARAHTDTQLKINLDRKHGGPESLFVNLASSEKAHPYSLRSRAVSWNLVGIYDITYAAMASGMLDAVVSWGAVQEVTKPLEVMAARWKRLEVEVVAHDQQNVVVWADDVPPPGRAAWAAEVATEAEDMLSRVMRYTQNTFGGDAVNARIADHLNVTADTGNARMAVLVMEKIAALTDRLSRDDTRRREEMRLDLEREILPEIEIAGVYLTGHGRPHPVDIAAFSAKVRDAVVKYTTEEERGRISKSALFMSIQSIVDPLSRTSTGGGDRVTLSSLHTASRHLHSLYAAANAANDTAGYQALETHFLWVFDTLARDASFLYALRRTTELDMASNCYLHGNDPHWTFVSTLAHASIGSLVNVLPKRVTDAAGSYVQWACRLKSAATENCFDYFAVTEVRIKKRATMGWIFPEMVNNGAVLARHESGGMGFRREDDNLVRPFRQFNKSIMGAVPDDIQKSFHKARGHPVDDGDDPGWYITGIITDHGFVAVTGTSTEHGTHGNDYIVPGGTACIVELTRAEPRIHPLHRRAFLRSTITKPIETTDVPDIKLNPNVSASVFMNRSMVEFCKRQQTPAITSRSTATGVVERGIVLCRRAMTDVLTEGSVANGKLHLHGGAAIVYNLSHAMETTRKTGDYTWTRAAVLYPLFSSRMMKSDSIDVGRVVDFFDIDMKYVTDRDTSAEAVLSELTEIAKGVADRVALSYELLHVPNKVRDEVCGVRLGATMTSEQTGDGDVSVSLPHHANIMDIAWSLPTEADDSFDVADLPVTLGGWAAELGTVAGGMSQDVKSTVHKIRDALTQKLTDDAHNRTVSVQTLQSANDELYNYWSGVCTKATAGDDGTLELDTYASSRCHRYRRDIVTLMAIMSIQDALAAMNRTSKYTPQRKKFETLKSDLLAHGFDRNELIVDVVWVAFHQHKTKPHNPRKPHKR